MRNAGSNEALRQEVMAVAGYFFYYARYWAYFATDCHGDQAIKWLQQ